MSIVMRDWLREQAARRKREGRIFVLGFWTGMAPGILMCVAVVVLALAFWPKC